MLTCRRCWNSTTRRLSGYSDEVKGTERLAGDGLPWIAAFDGSSAHRMLPVKSGPFAHDPRTTSSPYR